MPPPPDQSVCNAVRTLFRCPVCRAGSCTPRTWSCPTPGCCSAAEQVASLPHRLPGLAGALNLDPEQPWPHAVGRAAALAWVASMVAANTHTHSALGGAGKFWAKTFGTGSASVAAAQTARPRVSECHLVCSRRAGVACSSRRRATGPLGLGGAVSGFLRPEQRPGWTCGAVEVQPQHIAIAAAAVPRPA